ncbi:MAG: T9SS type A sorting domain-containing protein [Ignavibacteria bacterium]
MRIFFIVSLLIVLNFSLIYSQYTGPESVTYDSVYNRYLVTNSNGKIMQRSSTGVVTDFVSSSGGTHGIAIYNGVAYACQGSTVRGFSLSNAAQVFTATITGATFLNGIAIDNTGIIYLSDFTNKRIYKLNSSNGSFWQYITSTISTPNGLVLDFPRNRLLICCWGGSAPVRSINLADSSMSVLITTPYSNCDGIKLDKYDNVYISTWGIQSVVRYDINFTLSPVVVTSGLSSPADIYINKFADTLAVPNAGNNTVTFHNIVNISGIQQVNTNIPGNLKLHQNFPNPFNPVTKIRFDVPATGNNIKLSVFNSIGQQVSVLVNEYLTAGSYEADFAGTNLASGMYYYKLESVEFTETRKMILIK